MNQLKHTESDISQVLFLSRSKENRRALIWIIKFGVDQRDQGDL